MPTDAVTNFAYSTVAVPPFPPTSGETLTLQPGDGARFPTPPFNAPVWAAQQAPLYQNAEIIRVTDRVGDTLIFTRTQETADGAPATPRAIQVGDQIAAPLTAKLIHDLQNAGNLTTGTLDEARLPASVVLYPIAPTDLPAHHLSHAAGGPDAIALDTLAPPTDITALNATPSAHGLLPKLQGNLRTLFDGSGHFRTLDVGDMAPHAAHHQAGGPDPIALDTLGAPADTTILNATTGAHGLLPKLPGDASLFLTGTGNWAPGGASAPAAHHTTHELGGADVVALDGSQIATGTVNTARLAPSVVLRPIPIADLPPHRPTHQAGGSDAIALDTLAPPTDTVLLNATAGAHGLLPKLAGDSTLFLSGAGDWRSPDSGVPKAHHASHELGGADMVALDAAQVTTGVLNLARLPASVQLKPMAVADLPPHHATHTASGSDPIGLDLLAPPTDVTALNATTSAHGLLPKLSGNLATFFDGSGAYRVLAASDLAAHASKHQAGGSDPIALDLLAPPTDVTTLNASASAHGLAPKLSGNALTYLDGAGNWSTPPGSGGPHHATHELGGSDMVALDASQIATGQLSLARLPQHHITHAAGGTDALALDTLAPPSDVTVLNATTSAHGLLPKLPGTATLFLSGAGDWRVAGGLHHATHELGGTDVVALDASQIATGTFAVARLPASVQLKPIAVTDLPAHRLTHQAGGADAIALDLLGPPTDVTTLNASASAHGLLPKLSGNASLFLNGAGLWHAPDGGIPAGHHASHELGGSDVVALDASQVVTGTLAAARIPAHRLTHQAGGSDAIALDLLAPPTDVTTLNATSSAHGLLPKLAGDSSLFLSGAGDWRPVALPGSPGIHHTTHELGGLDQLAIDASLLTSGTIPAARIPVPFILSAANASLRLTDSSQGANLKTFQLRNTSQTLQLQALNDDTSVNGATTTWDRSGNVWMPGCVSIGGTNYGGSIPFTVTGLAYFRPNAIGSNRGVQIDCRDMPSGKIGLEVLATPAGWTGNLFQLQGPSGVVFQIDELGRTAVGSAPGSGVTMSCYGTLFLHDQLTLYRAGSAIQHTASAAAPMQLQLRNTYNGTGACYGIRLGNDVQAVQAQINLYGSGYGGVFADQPDTLMIEATGAGGINMNALGLGLTFWTNYNIRGGYTLNGLQFIGNNRTTAPALKANSTTLEVKRADDTAYAPLRSSTLQTEGNVGLGTAVPVGETRLQVNGNTILRPSAAAAAWGVTLDVAALPNNSNAVLVQMPTGWLGYTWSQALNGAPTLLVDQNGNLTSAGNITEKNRLVPMGHWTDVPYSAGNFTASPGSWTVDLADVVTYMYAVVGKTLFLVFYLQTTTTSAGASFLSLALPGGFTIRNTSLQQSASYNDGGAWTPGVVIFTAGEQRIKIYKDVGGSTWSGTANGTYVSGEIILPLQ